MQEPVDRSCFLQKSLSCKAVYQGLAVFPPDSEIFLQEVLANQVFSISANQERFLLSQYLADFLFQHFFSFFFFFFAF